MRSFKSSENIHKKEGESYYVVSANKASSVTLQSSGNESQRKHTAILRISNRQSIQSSSKTKLFGANFMQIGLQTSKLLEMENLEMSSCEPAISEVVTSLTHSGY